MLQPELCECSSRTTFVSKSCDALHLQVAILQPELWECSSRTTFVLKTCDFWAGAAGARFAYYFCALKLRYCSGSSGMLFAYYTFVIKSCDFEAGAAAVQAGGTRDSTRS